VGKKLLELVQPALLPSGSYGFCGIPVVFKLLESPGI
jgi:hypothetical protein